MFVRSFANLALTTAFVLGALGASARAGLEYRILAATDAKVAPLDGLLSRTVSFDTFGTPAISPGSNWIAFPASSGSSSSDSPVSSVWRSSGVEGAFFQELARAGDSSASGSRHIVSFGDPQISDAGLAAFYTATDAATNSGSLWKASPGNLAEMVKEGDIISSSTVSNLLPQISLNAKGDLAYGCDLIGSSATQHAIIRTSAGGALQIVRSGDLADWDDAPASYYASYGSVFGSGSIMMGGPTSYPVFSSLGTPVVNEDGSMYFPGAYRWTIPTFSGFLPGMPVNPSSTPSPMELYLAGAEWKIVGTYDYLKSGSTYVSIGSMSEVAYTPVWLAFTTTLASTPAGTDRAVVELVGYGKYRFVAREGDPAPGTGQTFADFSSPALDAAGNVAFQATLADGRHSLWVEDAAHQIHLVAVEGTPIDGGSRVVESLLFQGRQGMSRDGTLVFSAHFTDSTSALITARYREPVPPVPLALATMSSRRVMHTSGKRYTLQGTTAGSDRVVALQYRVGSSPWRSVKGQLDHWNIPLSLRIGRNRVQLKVRDESGATVRKSVVIVRDESTWNFVFTSPTPFASPTYSW